MFLPSSAIQCIQDSPHQLTVYYPPNYKLVVGWVIVGVVCLFVNGLIAYFTYRKVWLTALTVAACLVIAGVVWSIRSNVVLSKSDGSIVIREYILFHEKSISYPLGSVRQAVIATDENKGHLMSLAMDTGQEIPVGSGWMARDGFYEAAQAINRFLAGQAGPSTPGQNSMRPQLPGWAAKMQEKGAQQAEDYQKRGDGASLQHTEPK